MAGKWSTWIRAIPDAASRAGFHHLWARVHQLQSRLEMHWKEPSIPFSSVFHFRFWGTGEKGRNLIYRHTFQEPQSRWPLVLMSTYTPNTHTWLEAAYLYVSVLWEDQYPVLNNIAFFLSHHALCSPTEEMYKHRTKGFNCVTPYHAAS